MPRPTLGEEKVHSQYATGSRRIVREIQQAVTANDVVVVGMRRSPALDAPGIHYRYLEYGSYFGRWRRRTALKMWTGGPTFPMVFANGVLVGGARDIDRLIVGGELTRLLTKQSNNAR